MTYKNLRVIPLEKEKIDWENPEHVLKSLIVLYGLQTQDEKMGGVTVHDNQVGFNAIDAPFLTSVAEQILHKSYGVSEAQYTAVRRALRKYENQIISYGLSSVTLPPTAKVYWKKKSKPDGMLKAVNGTLQFIPYTFPTREIMQYGFIWKKEEKLWEGTLTEGTISAVMRLFPQTEKHESILKFEEKQNEDIYLPSEIESSSLFETQKESVKFLLKHSRALLALAPGTGKTAVSIHAAKEQGGCNLIVCPLTLVRNWQKEIKMWIGDESVIWHKFIGNSAECWAITNYETAVKYQEKLASMDWLTLIIDESIMVKNRKAKRTKAMQKLAKSMTNVWLLSGSPTSRFYDDLWSQLNILKPKQFRSYWRFADNYCVVERNQWGTAVIGNKPNSHDHLKQDLVDLYFCRTQDEILDLPDWIIEDVDIEMYKKQYELYDQMERTFLADLPEGDTLLAPNILAQLTRLIQFASNPVLLDDQADYGAKWDAAIEMLQFVEFPVIIWTNFIATANKMSEKLGKKYRIGVLTGKTATDNRQDIVDNFQTNNLDIIVAHPAVGKFGLTLTKAKTAIYLERSYNGDDYYQSLHRIRRIGTTHSPYVIHLRAARPDSSAPTIDHVIGRVLEFRKNSSLSLTSGIIREAYKEEV